MIKSISSWLIRRSSYALLLTTIFAIILGIASAVALFTYRNAVDHAIALNRSTADLFTGLVLEHQKAVITVVELYASRPLVADIIQNKDYDALAKYLSSLRKEYRETAAAFVTDPNGAVLAVFPPRSLPYRDASDRDWYKGASRDWKPQTSPVTLRLIQEKDLMTVVSAPILDRKNTVIGILGISQRTVGYRRFVDKFGLDRATKVTVVDQKNNIVYATGRFDPTQLTQFELTAPEQGGTRRTADFEIRDRKGDRIVALAPIDEIGWLVAVEKDKASILKAQSKNFAVIFGIAGLIFVLITISANILRSEFLLRRAAEVERIRLATAVDQASEAISIVSLDGIIEYVNPAFCILSGFDRSELIGDSIKVISCGEGGTDYYSVTMSTIETRSSWSGHARSKRRDGILVDTELTIFPIRDTSGTILNYVNILHDIGEKLELEEQVRHAQKMDAIGTLAGGIAHDFNNVLSAIIGFSEMAKDEVASGTAVERRLERVLAAALRGRDLVRQILTFSRKTKQEQRALQLSPVIEESLKLLRPSLPTTIDITFTVMSESGVVLVDPVQIEQVIMNLFTNAAYAMRRKGGTLRIDLSDFSLLSPTEAPHPRMSPGLYLKLSVSDTGEGIPAEVMARIFDPFFTTKAQGEGTGLGLSVVHGIIESHGGAITVESEPGKGSAFTVYLPKFEGIHRDSEMEEDEPLPQGKERVLFIDDEEALAGMGAEILAGLGYQVISMTDPRQAVEVFTRQPDRFDLIITDQTMPGMTGVELARTVLTVRRDIPVILCTGFSHLVDGDSAKAAGVRALVMKPVTRREISRIIRKVLDEVTAT